MWPSSFVVTPPKLPTAFSPGENHHHGIEVNGSVRQPLQHELFTCQVDKGGVGRVREGTQQEVKGLLSSLTDNAFLVLHQFGLHHGGKLLQSLHGLKRQDPRCSGQAGSPLPRALL